MTMNEFSKINTSLKVKIEIAENEARRLAAPALSAEVEALKQRYFYMLRYYVNNPGADISAELRQLEKKLDIVQSSLLREKNIESNNNLYYALLRFQRRRPEDTLEKLYTDYLAESERLSKDSAAFTNSTARAKIETIASDIFEHIFTHFYMDSDTERLVESMLIDDSIADYDRRQWLAALGFGFAFVADTARLRILSSIADSGDDVFATEALAWIFNAPRQSRLDDEARAIFDASIRQFPDLYLEFITHTLRTQTGKTLADSSNFLRVISKISPEISQKLSENKNLEDLDPEELARMAGYDHEAIDLITSIRKGHVDLMLAGFKSIKDSSFFSKVNNWFLPFHTSHSNLADIVDGDGVALAEIISRTPTSCSPDKYAILLNLRRAPAHIRQTLLENSINAYGGMHEQLEHIEKMIDSESSQRRTAQLREWLAVYDRVSIYLDSLQQPDFTYAGFEPDIDSVDASQLTGFADELSQTAFALDSFEFLEKALSLPGSSPQLVHNLAKALIQRKEYDKAERILNNFGYDSSRTDVLSATVAFARGNYADAKNLLLKAGFEEQLGNSEQLTLMLAQMASGEWTQAAATKNIDLNSPALRCVYGIALWNAGSRREAVQTLLPLREQINDIMQKLSDKYPGFDFTDFMPETLSDTLAFVAADSSFIQ